MTMDAQTTLPPMVQYLDGLVDQLRLYVASVLDAGAEESVHQARVTTRRLRAASDLLRPILADKPRHRLNRVLRRIRRCLGPMRDLDVLVGHLAEFAENEACAGGAEWLRGELLPVRAELLTTAAGDKTIARLPVKLAPWAKVRAQILSHAPTIDGLLAARLHEQIDAFSARATELTAAVPGVDPHQVRIAGKALRYTLELATAQGHPLDESLFKVFKKMQDALGTWHDYVVLTEQAMQHSAHRMLAHHNATLQHKLLALARESLSDAEEYLAKFGRLWTEHGVGLAESIRTAFPVSRPVEDVATLPKTDPDPVETPETEEQGGPH